jgi:hypothetical protein
MNVQDQTAIEGLFDRLKQAEAQGGPRDVEAEHLIASLVQQQPAAPYLMAQAVIVQEQALKQLQRRVEALEKDLASRPQAGGGFLGGLFGAGAAVPQPTTGPSAAPPPPPAAGGRSGGWGSNQPAQPQAAPMQRGQTGEQGGFLASAMQTAVGVAGGVLLGNAIGGMFADNAEAAPGTNAPTDTGGMGEQGLAEQDVPPEDEGGGFFDLFGGDEEF